MLDPEKYLSTPIAVTWDITRRCNLSCPFCLEDSLEASAEELPEEVRRVILSEIIKCKVLQVNISGGEPFILPELEDYAAELIAGGSAVTITSNGLLVTKQRAEKLAAAGVKTVEVTVYPEVMGRSFRAIDYLLEAGIEVLPRAVFTRQMKDCLNHFLSSCEKAGLKKLVMQEVVPQGRGMRDYGTYKLSEEEVFDAIAIVKRYRQEHEGFSVEFTSSTLADCESEEPTECIITRNIRKGCEIRPDGNVLPCYPAMVYEIDNNLLKKGLKQCWLDIPDLYRAALAESIDVSCARCGMKEACPGGCPAEHEEWTRRGFSSAEGHCRFFKD
jgi:radical SAM protein with 4Fe4S-binding SPASM domain